MYSYGPPHMAKQKQDNQHEHTYSSYVRTQDVTLKTCQRRWIIGRSGERGSGISMLVVWHDDDDDEIAIRNAIHPVMKAFWGIDTNFEVIEKLASVSNMHGRTTEENIFRVIENTEFSILVWKPLTCITIDYRKNCLWYKIKLHW